MPESNWLRRFQPLLATSTSAEEVRLAKTDLKLLVDSAAKHVTLYEVGKLIASERELEALLRLAMDKVIEMTGAQRGFIALVDKKGEFDYKAARHFEKTDIEKPETALCRTILRKVCERGEKIYSRDALADPRFADVQSILGLKLLSVLCVPIRHKDRTAGVIYLDHLNQPDIFDAAVAELLEAFSEQIAIALDNAHAFADLQQSNRALVNALREKFKIIGFSPAMAEILETVDQIANTEATVLIEGESGTGKELIATALHYHNRARCERPFVVKDCGAFTETLIESELFGHVKGAFTGALEARKGIFESAEGGTVFLDEIGNMSVATQAKLLRVLQKREFSPVGSAETKRCNVRVLAATNRNLKQMVESKEFREDLYYRLNVIPLKIPPLRERREDILPLIEHFLNVFSKDLHQERPLLSPAAKQLLLQYDYPGNIRELKNAIERAVILCKDNLIDVALLPEALVSAQFSGAENLPELSPPEQQETFSARKKRVIQQWETQEIITALIKTKGSQIEAAELLGLDRGDLNRKVRQYGINAQHYEN